jgi:acetyltransferase-like isoleucine patch superfamily enzyme
VTAAADIQRVFGLTLATARARRTLGRQATGGARIFGPPPLIEGAVSIGPGFRSESRQFRSSISAGAGGRVAIGARVFVNQGVTIHSDVSVSIGDDVLLGDLVGIYDTSFHEVDEGAGVTRAPVVIGRNVWLARAAIVLPGVTIGDHSVIAAGAVVTGAVPPRSLVAGVPGRVVRALNACDSYRRG